MARSTLPTPPGATSSGPPPPAKVPKMPPLPRRRRPAMMALAVLVVVGGGVAVGQAITQLSDRKPVVVMARAVPVGQELTRADLTTAMVGLEPTLVVVPGRELDRAIGRRAVMDLPAGMLLSPTAISEVINPLPGKQLVPVALKASRLPGRGLKPGDLVTAVFDSTGEVAQVRKPILGIVDRVVPPGTDGLVVVDLLVEDKYANQLAEQVGSGQVVLVLTPRRP